MPKRPTAGDDDVDKNKLEGKRAKTVDDELSLMIAQAAVAGNTALVAELKEQQAKREEQKREEQQAKREEQQAKREEQQAKREEQQAALKKEKAAKAAYDKAKEAYERIKTPGPEKDAAKVVMDQAHAIYMAFCACVCPRKELTRFRSASSTCSRPRFVSHVGSRF